MGIKLLSFVVVCSNEYLNMLQSHYPTIFLAFNFLIFFIYLFFQLTESRVCVPDDPSCSNFYPFGLYQLKVNQWQQCVPFSEHTIGDNDGILNSGSHSDTFYKHWPQVGTQKRSMSCFDESGILVSLSFCEDKQLPTNTRACIIAQDCVVSDWTDWEVTQGGCISAGGKVC